jgi:hypothetical protein
MFILLEDKQKLDVLWFRDTLPTCVSAPISVPQPTFALHTDASMIGLASVATPVVRVFTAPSQIPGVASVPKRQLPTHSVVPSSELNLPIATQAKLSLKSKVCT